MMMEVPIETLPNLTIGQLLHQINNEAIVAKFRLIEKTRHILEKSLIFAIWINPI